MRPEYLDRTLESLLKYNETSLNNIYAYEDSSESEEFYDVCDKYDVFPIFGGENKGQIHAIDYLMSFVTTDFYLHLEDDWECAEFGFIPEGIAVMMNPEIIQVNGRGRSPRALNGHPVTDGYLSHDYMGWTGWMYAPTLNKTWTYQQLMEYRLHTTWNPHEPWLCEKEIGKKITGKKYVTEKTYFKHIGENSTFKLR